MMDLNKILLSINAQLSRNKSLCSICSKRSFMCWVEKSLFNFTTAEKSAEKTVF